MKKKLLAFIMALSLSPGTVPAYAAISLTIDGRELQTDVPPVIVDGRTLVPVRAIFESFGASVMWDDATKTVTADRNGEIISLTLDSDIAYVNGQSYTLDVPAQSIDGRTMVPARFIAEQFDCDVLWDDAAQAVIITSAALPSIGSSNQDSSLSAIGSDPQPSTSDDSISKTVYVTETGSRYHYDNNCNGGTYYESTLDDALARGLTPCNKCVL